jgi:beta-lactamase superfamily II metal-dependent hydrolase
VDIVVCTHNDADHANGILGFLEAGLRCKEVWLPGRWLSTLPDVLKPFAGVFDELVNDVVQWEAALDRKEWPAGLSPLEVYRNA